MSDKAETIVPRSSEPTVIFEQLCARPSIYEIRFDPPMAIDSLKRVLDDLSSRQKSGVVPVPDSDNGSRKVSSLLHQPKNSESLTGLAQLRGYYEERCQWEGYRTVVSSHEPARDLFYLPEETLDKLGLLVSQNLVE